VNLVFEPVNKDKLMPIIERIEWEKYKNWNLSKICLTATTLACDRSMEKQI